MFKDDLNEKVSWLVWHYDKKFNNVFEIPFDEKLNKYNAKIEDYCLTIMHILSYFNEIWGLLKYMQLYDPNNEHRYTLRNVAIKSASEFHLFHTRKGVNIIEHLIKWFYEYDEFYKLETVKKRFHFPKEYVPEDKKLELAKIYRSKICELIEFIADDTASVEDFIDQEFF